MEFEDDYLIIAIDSASIKVTNRGKWMQDKWNVNNKNKGYIKIRVAVNVKTKKILSMDVTTDEHVHDSKALPELVENIIESDGVTAIGKLVLRKSKKNMFRYPIHKHSYFNIVKFDGNLTIFH